MKYVGAKKVKKKTNFISKLNKNTIFKLVIASAIIIVIYVMCGVFVFNQCASHTYEVDFVGFSQSAERASEQAVEELSPDLSSLEADESLQSELISFIRNNGGADAVVLFADGGGGTILGEDGIISGNLGDFGLTYNAVTRFTLGDKLYVFAPARLGDSVYRAGLIFDYTERQAVIDAMLGNTAAILVVGGILTVCALVGYAYFTGNAMRYGKYKYRLYIDKTGRIKSSNKNFKRSFPSVAVIPSPARLDKLNYNLVKLSSDDGEKLVAMRVSAKRSGDFDVYAGDISNADSFLFATENNTDEFVTRNSFSMAYESFTATGKRVLVGEILITNLDSIKTLFGKSAATEIQKTVIKKVREKFTYVFELDFGSLGIIFPDGKKLDNLVSDMDENFRYITTPIKLSDNLFTVELKAGFAMCDDTMEDRSFKYAMRVAEAARQRATDTGIADYVVYHESQKKLYSKYLIEFDIKKMLAEEAFEMEYQPQYNIKEGRIVGFEALFRVKKTWNVNVDTFSFITYAERTGAMVQLGDFIFNEGMKFAKQLEDKNISVSLNVSPVQLMQAGFVENFLKIYKKYGLKRGSVCVEITESFLMTNFMETMKKLEVLRDNGINVHLDDFGTEYSSLLYIKKLPISTIKIDKEFVKDIFVSKESQAVIKFITGIAKLLNISTICEGVETTKEYDMLNYLGCDTVQGWLIGKSMKPDEAIKAAEQFDFKKVVAEYNAKNVK